MQNEWEQSVFFFSNSLKFCLWQVLEEKLPLSEMFFFCPTKPGRTLMHTHAHSCTLHCHLVFCWNYFPVWLLRVDESASAQHGFLCSTAGGIMVISSQGGQSGSLYNAYLHFFLVHMFCYCQAYLILHCCAHVPPIACQFFFLEGLDFYFLFFLRIMIRFI